jgi:NADH-quinone oxidoreductase subunit G
MAVITVDGKDIEVGDSEGLNVIQAADRAGVAIPFYCWHPGLSVVASCRMCLVETGQKNKETGKVDMLPKLVPACQTPVKDGLVVITDSEKVKANQNFVQEGLLLDHPVDCPICDQAGECWLQDYYFQYGHKQRRADVRPFTSQRRDLGPHVTLFVDRCVMCSRCVRFTREVSGGGELQVIERGSHAEIDVFPGFPLEDHLSGNVNDLCPVGALCSKDFLYQQRVWFMEPHDSVCTRCSTGCSVQLHESQSQLYRIQPRYNPNANEWWMCDIGRYQNQFISAPERLTGLKRRGENSFEDVSWTDGLKAIEEKIAALVNSEGGKRFAVVVSPFLTVEEAYLLALYARSIGPDVPLVLGFVPTVAEDEVFKTGFTIRRERCPNRLGVLEVLKHFESDVIEWPAFVQKVSGGEITGAYITGHYPDAWITEVEAEPFRKLRLLVSQDILPSPVVRMSHYVVPGVTFAEKDGCYVNHAGLIQKTEWAIRPVEGAHVDGQTFQDLLKRRGLYSAEAVLKEAAAAIPFFQRVAGGVPEAGLNLLTGKEKTPRTTALGTVTHPLPTFRSLGSRMLEVEQSTGG